MFPKLTAPQLNSQSMKILQSSVKDNFFLEKSSLTNLKIKAVDKMTQFALNGNKEPTKQRSDMNIKIKQIRELILPILQRYGVSKAALFGSVVKEQIRPDSDVDILVQIDKDISLLDFVGLKLELEQALKTDVDVVEYDTIKPLLRETILKEQQVIL